ncbi:MAG: phage integrase N-terminal SAM-like domain-containing protein [Saprospiraceae bacterium]|nr:phage integrase N-terminal SAM-like domain-containing protein [Saprospiraceae bacterium]
MPYSMTEGRARIKAQNGSYYHYNQKLRSIPNTIQSLEVLKASFNNQYEEQSIVKTTPVRPYKELSEVSADIIFKMEQKLQLKAYSPAMVKTYLTEIKLFLTYVEPRDPGTLSKADIEAYIYQLITKYNISESKQKYSHQCH